MTTVVDAARLFFFVFLQSVHAMNDQTIENVSSSTSDNTTSRSSALALPKDIPQTAFDEAKSQIQTWISEHQEQVANNVDMSSSAYDTYTQRMNNVELFDTFFSSTLVNLFKTNLKSCSQCRESCPLVMKKLGKEIGHALQNVAYASLCDTTGALAYCMERVCPAAFNPAICGTWVVRDAERNAALFAALATGLGLCLFFTLMFACLGSKKKGASNSNHVTVLSVPDVDTT